MSALRAVEPPARLDELAALINAEHEHVWRAGRKALEHAVKAGKALLDAQAQVPKGRWLTWLSESVTVHPTSAYKYMRLARHERRVLSDDVTGVEHGLRLIAEEPWHDRTRLSDDEKARMALLAESEGLNEVARAFGVAKSTVWRWTSDKSPPAKRASSLKKRGRAPQHALIEITDQMVETVASWLVKRFSNANYPAIVTDQVRDDALELLGLALGATKPPETWQPTGQKQAET